MTNTTPGLEAHAAALSGIKNWGSEAQQARNPMRQALQHLLDRCEVADGEDGKLSTMTVRRICKEALGEQA